MLGHVMPRIGTIPKQVFITSWRGTITQKGKNIEDIVYADLYLNNVPTYFIIRGEMHIKEISEEDAF